ncbi:MAG: alpha/beta fold hydrolase [Syntrophobacteraceae bacterium]
MTIVFKICLLLVFVAAAVSLITYSFFWYENAGGPRRRILEASGKGLPRLMFQGMITGFAGLLVVMITYPLGFVPRLWRPKRISPSQPVIILTHGLYHNAAAWLFVRHRLRKAGFANVFVMNYRCLFTSFDATFQKFEKFVLRSRSAAPGQPLILVGHSLGGLLSRVYAERSSDQNAPAAVITLGTPHRGSRMAAFAIGRLGRGLMYEGPLYHGFEREALRMRCPGIALISPVDSLVLPAQGLQAPYPGWTEYETVPVSHVAMLYSKAVAGKVIEFIKT